MHEFNYIPLIVLPNNNNMVTRMRLFELFYRSISSAAIRVFDLDIHSNECFIPNSISLIVYHQ